MSRRLLIVYHSLTGGTARMAQAVADGARDAEPALDVRLQPAAATHPPDLLAADGYVFAAPETLASVSGLMKDLFDRCYYPVLGAIDGRPHAIVVCAGSDGTNAVRQLQRIAAGWRLRPVVEPLIVCTHAQTAEAILAPKQIAAADLEKGRAIGATLAAGLLLGVF
jgi:multimeric flavodoxin WrbA